MESKTTIDQIVDNVIVNGVEVNRKNVHYMDDLVTILLDGNVFIEDKPIHFRFTEYNLLKALTSKPKKPWGRIELLKEVWGDWTGLRIPLDMVYW